MADLHTRIRDQPPDVLNAIAASMTARANEPEFRRICDAYMREVGSHRPSRVLEVGCGSGAATKLILENIPLDELVGVDPSSAFVEMAEAELRADSRAHFHVGDAVATGEEDASFDLVIAHTVFSHLPDPEAAIRECHRVLCPGGRLAVFDGDYATLTFELFPGDPLQAAASVAIRNMIHAPHIMRRLPFLVSTAGFKVESVSPQAYVKTDSADYLIGLITRSVDAAIKAGEFGGDLAEGFKREAKKRVEDGSFYGAIVFVTLTARK